MLGGGGLLGAAEAGMLRALVEAGVTPELVVGASVGAINGAAIAAQPDTGAATRLVAMWSELTDADVFGGSVVSRALTLARSRTHLHPAGAVHDLLARHIPEGTCIEDLPVPFQCVAACIERASEHWFTRGPLLDAISASTAVPGLLPPVRIGDEHFFDGGLVNSIPIGRAVSLGAREIYVCQVGRIESPLRPPRLPWEVGLVAFEIARRHRFHTDLAAVPPGVRVHVLPTGAEPRGFTDLANLRYRDVRRVAERAELAYQASREYLRGVV